MRISLCGAAGEVTGSGYLVQTATARVLVDFGMFQGRGATEARNRELGPVDPTALDAVVLTHAHLDHSGRLPLLPSRGFRGPILATDATADFARLILADSAHLQRADSARQTRRRRRRGLGPREPLYAMPDVEALQSQFVPLPYGEPREVTDGVSVRLFEAGHIPGSASVEMTVRESGADRVVVFSGDIGPRDSPILRDPTPPPHADLVFLESTYGDREHRPLAETVREFHEILTAAIRARSKVLIPAFAIGRAQQILYHIAELVRGGQLPRFPIYLDSPMAIEATKLYARHRDLFDADAARLLAAGQLRRDLAGLRFTATAAESMALNESWDMAVIIAGSGMCDGGRILHHLKHNLWRHGVAVVIVGFQVRGSLGEQLIHGAREVRILGEKILVRASVHTLGGFSAHAGRRELVEWAGRLTPDRPRVVLTHGEPEARDALKAALLAEHGVEAECPGPGATIELA